MISRRDFLQATIAASAITGLSGKWSGVCARQTLSEDDLLNFTPLGTVTLLHIADLHAQLKPIYYREPLLNLGANGKQSKPPHITGHDFLKFYKLNPGSPEAYALTGQDFNALAKIYGKMGGLDRVGSILNRVRDERPGACLLLDSGDSWQGSYGALQTKGQDVIDVMTLLKPDAMTGHWEFTYGAKRVQEAIASLGFPFLAGNVIDQEWEEPVFESTAHFERGGVKIAVIGQAFPYTPIANPRWMIPDWSFGIREKRVQSHIDAARAKGAGLVVLLSHNGFDVDVKMAHRLRGVDVILTGHTHDALPQVYNINKTLLVASGSNGKFVSRLDLDVQGGEIKGFSYRLIPVFSDVISSDKTIASKINQVRAPFKAELSRVLGHSDGLLYRRGTFNGTFDDLICDALRSELDAQIALSPGFRWGTCILPGQDITLEDLFNATAITYPSVYRSEMTGQQIKAILEDVADNLFHEDPYYAQGGDMVRTGGLGFHINPAGLAGARISKLVLLEDGGPLEASKTYSVAGWASVSKPKSVSEPKSVAEPESDSAKAKPIWEVVEQYLAKHNGSYVQKGKAPIHWQP